MKIIAKDYKKGFLKIKIESSDDLWALTYLIEKKDFIKAFTYRKIKVGEENQKIVKKACVVSLEVEKIEFSKFSNILRVSGIIKEANDDIPIGSHHTINLEENSEFSLQKNKLLKYQIEKIEEASAKSNEKILICVHDREEAYFAVLKKYGFDILSEIKGNVQKKADVKIEAGDFFKAIKDAILEYDKRFCFTSIIIASPGFWKDYIKKQIDETELRKKVIYGVCSSASINGINEVIKRPEVQIALKKDKFSKEMEKIDELLFEISKNNKAEYGLNNVIGAVNAGAVSALLISDNFILKKRQDENFEEIEKLMKHVEDMNGKIHIISSEHEGGKKLDGLGGIAAILRYKLNY